MGNGFMGINEIGIVLGNTTPRNIIILRLPLEEKSTDQSYKVYLLFKKAVQSIETKFCTTLLHEKSGHTVVYLIKL